MECVPTRFGSPNPSIRSILSKLLVQLLQHWLAAADAGHGLDKLGRRAVFGDTTQGAGFVGSYNHVVLLFHATRYSRMYSVKLRRARR